MTIWGFNTAAVALMFQALATPVSAAEVSCRFQAQTDRTDVTIMSEGKTRWAGTIEKNDTKTVQLPEGPFIVISKVYNPNLKTEGDVRTEAHTRMCKQDVALPVPLFSDTP